MRPLLHIGTDPLALESVAASLGGGGGADGAVVTFLGLVRNHNLGRSVRYLEYEAYEPLALKATLPFDSGGFALPSVIRVTVMPSGSDSGWPSPE